MATNEQKSGPFRTIGDVSAELGLPTHILRYWETRFTQLRPLTRAGNRRYYRPEDVDLVRQINQLLNVEGYTIKGAQKTLFDGGVNVGDISPTQTDLDAKPLLTAADQIEQLKRIRDRLQAALNKG